MLQTKLLAPNTKVMIVSKQVSLLLHTPSTLPLFEETGSPATKLTQLFKLEVDNQWMAHLKSSSNCDMQIFYSEHITLFTYKKENISKGRAITKIHQAWNIIFMGVSQSAP